MQAALAVVMAKRRVELRGNNGRREVYVVLAFDIGMVLGALLASHGSPF